MFYVTPGKEETLRKRVEDLTDLLGRETKISRNKERRMVSWGTRNAVIHKRTCGSNRNLYRRTLLNEVTESINPRIVTISHVMVVKSSLKKRRSLRDFITTQNLDKRR